MKNLNIVILLLLSWSALSGSTPEVVVTKGLAAYHGKSYLYSMEIVLLPGFEVSADVHGDFFIAYERIVNQPASVDRNFVRSELTLTKGIVNESQLSTLSSDKKRTTYNYSDGLGRFTQEVILEGSPAKNDVIRFASYDDFGREPLSYLPLTIKDNIGGYAQAVLENQSKFYSPTGSTRPYGVAPDVEPYGVNVFNNSPLNTVVQSYGPGEDWHATKANKYKRTTPKVNFANEVRRFVYNGVDPPQSSSFYPQNVLTVHETIDEENHIFRSYSNIREQVVLERKGDGTTWLDTYFVYDHSGKLSFVFPPEATSRIFQTNSEYQGKTAAQQQAFIDLWAYQYKYDFNSRLSEKRIPGAGWIYMLYDKWDRIALLQDATQRLSNQWTFTKYDIHNRVIMTGITTGTRGAMQNGLSAAVNRFELPAANSVGYSNSTFPSHTEGDLISVNYFDSYGFLANSGWDAEGLSYAFVKESGFDQSYFPSLKGYSTGSKIKLLGTSKWINSVIYYNAQYQVIQTIAENHLGGLDRITKLIDFDGAELQSKQVHTSPTTGSLTVAEEYIFDHSRRLIQLKHQINNGTKITLVSNKFNELGQHIEKNLHSIDDGSSFLQSVDMRYNVRGWITSINNSKLSNDGVKNNDTGDLFGMEILYNDPSQVIADGNSGTFTTRRLYDGNIAAIRWMTDNRSGIIPKENIYGFAYDPWKRFRNSYYATNNAGQWSASPGYYNETVSRFDANGNIGGEVNGTNPATLSRTGLLSGAKITFDNLAYRYAGNQLKNVTDNTNNNFGFSDKPGIPLTTDEFLYDANGNLQEDMNRSISKISYNHLNLPTAIEITRADGKVNKIEYLYDAAGNKLSRLVKLDNVQVWKTDYVNGIQYDNGKISFVTTPEGRAVFNGTTYDYEYFYKDHQDNVRLVYGALKETARYKATMEPELASTEEDSELGFGNIPSRRTSSFNEIYNYTRPSDKTPKPGYSALCSSFESRTIGPVKSLHVSPGDIVYMESFAKYTVPLAPNHGMIAATAVGIALNAALGISPSEEAKLYNGIKANAGAVSPNSDGATMPKAYLAFLFFDDNDNFIRSGAERISINALNSFEKLSRSFTAEQSGDLYVYVASESNVASARVYFDDTYIIHEKNNVMLQVTQSSDYYPYGMSFNEYQADRLKVASTTPDVRYEPILRNRYRFQGQEQQTDLSLGWYAYKYRMHDATIGRFSSVDPLAEDYKYNSVYAFSENRLLDGVELEGLEWRLSTNFEIQGYNRFGNSVGPGNYGYVQNVSGHGYFTYVGEHQFQFVPGMVTGNPILQQTTFSGRAFFSPSDNLLTILNTDGSVLTRTPNEHGMIQLPHSGTEVTGPGTLGSFSAGENTIYNYYNRNDIVGGVQDQWAQPTPLVNLLNSIFQFNDLHSNAPTHVGDMKSPTNGQVNNTTVSDFHHADPGAIDVRFFGLTGGYRGDYLSPNFSAERTRTFISLMGQNGFTRVLVHPAIQPQLVTPGINVVADPRNKHHDHMHFDLNDR